MLTADVRSFRAWSRLYLKRATERSGAGNRPDGGRREENAASIVRRTGDERCLKRVNGIKWKSCQVHPGTKESEQLLLPQGRKHTKENTMHSLRRSLISGLIVLTFSVGGLVLPALSAPPVSAASVVHPQSSDPIISG